MHRASRWAPGAAGVVGMALVLTGCAASDDSAEGGTITLTVSTFNDFGYADLIEEYMDENPGIVVEETKAATGDELREKIITGLAAGSGLTDIVAVDTSWLPELKEYSDNFVDLTDETLDGRWPDWKSAEATTDDGKLIGYGTDMGPEVVAYRVDLFEAAGLPTDRDEVAELLGGSDASWEKYLEVGASYTEATGKAWFDSADAIYEGMVNQLEYPYEDEDDNLIALENDTVREMYDTVTDASNAGLSAGLSQWSTDWAAAFQSDSFATMLAPAWIVETITSNSAGSDAVWDLAPVFPDGGGNWGGSYLAVPTQSEHQEEAQALAAWLTAPEQQVRVFESIGSFPSAVEASEDEAVTSFVNDELNDTPTGQIYSDAAESIEVLAHKGPLFFAVTDAMRDAIDRVDVAKTDDADSSWEKLVTEIESLG